MPARIEDVVGCPECGVRPGQYCWDIHKSRIRFSEHASSWEQAYPTGNPQHWVHWARWDLVQKDPLVVAMFNAAQEGDEDGKGRQETTPE